jgi:RimJ/RimL family protein N-acetyltransferase
LRRREWIVPEFGGPDDAALTLRTTRLVLRPIRGGDEEQLFPHCSDPRLPRQMTWAPHASVDVTEGFVRACEQARVAGRGFVWCIFEDGAFRGVVGVEGITRERMAVRLDVGELGYWLGLPFHGRGLMTEAAGVAVGCAFARLGLHKVAVSAFTTNPASLRVIEKLGFTRIGLRRQDVFRDGAWHDQLAFEMLVDDEPARRLAARVLGDAPA